MKYGLIVKKTLLFQAIQFCQTVLIQTIQFSTSMLFSSIQPINRALSGATILGQSGSGSNSKEGVLHIPQSSSITGTSPSDCLVSYPGPTRWGGGVLPLCSGAVSVFYMPQPIWAIYILRWSAKKNHWNKKNGNYNKVAYLHHIYVRLLEIYNHREISIQNHLLLLGMCSPFW